MKLLRNTMFGGVPHTRVLSIEESRTDGEDQNSLTVVDEFRRENDTLQLSASSLSVKSGPAAARKAGWRKASGRLIVFTDDDTLPTQNWLEAYYDAFRKSGEDKIVFTGKVVVPISSEPTDYERNIANLESAEFITANCACAFSALIQVKGFDEAYRMAWREDSSLHFKFLSQHIPIRHLETAVVLHPVRSAAWGVSVRSEKKNMFNALLYRQFPTLYRSRIGTHFPWRYVAMVFSLVAGLVLLRLGMSAPGIACIAIWLVMETQFIFSRVRKANKSWPHILEMIVTSFVIPVVSVFWNGYGAVKYRVWNLEH